MSARTVIGRLGGIRPAAAKLGHHSHTTVQGWWDRDVIPARRQSEILALAQAEGVPITAADLIPTPGDAA